MLLQSCQECLASSPFAMVFVSIFFKWHSVWPRKMLCWCAWVTARTSGNSTTSCSSAFDRRVWKNRSHTPEVCPSLWETMSSEWLHLLWFIQSQGPLCGSFQFAKRNAVNICRVTKTCPAHYYYSIREGNLSEIDPLQVCTLICYQVKRIKKTSVYRIHKEPVLWHITNLYCIQGWHLSQTIMFNIGDISPSVP